MYPFKIKIVYNVIMIKQLLENNFNEFISGELLASELKSTRANVWKQIEKFKTQGYQIESRTNKGYRLVGYKHLVSDAAIKRYLTVPLKNIILLDEVDSTNSYVKREWETLDENTLVVSDYQTKGRGRYGRSFYSPKHEGIYLSYLLKPNFDDIRKTQLVTIAACLGVIDAIEKSCDVVLEIKWLNDIYYQKKKLCGILTEASIEMTSQQIQYLVVGIGINLFVQNIPDDLKNIMISLNKQIEVHELIATITNCFYKRLTMIETNRIELITDYSKRNMLLNQTIVYQQNKYVVKGISEWGHLIVEDKNSQVLELQAGEVSLHDN